jgi:ubiquinol-cytochrome c reductase iron-sulfur subunit
MSGGHTNDTNAEFDVDNPSVTRFDLVREGARRDGVEIVHYEPRFPVPGTKVERRIVRVISLLFILSGVAALGFVVAYVWMPWKYQLGAHADKFYTPVLGLSLGLALLLLGFGIITWAKKLFPAEVSVQERHDGASPHDEQVLTGATLVNMAEDVGVKRRPVLIGSLLVPAAALGVAAVVPLGGMIKSPSKPDSPLLNTGWNPKNNGGNKVRLTREDGTPIRPEDVSVGGQITVFPGIPRGATNVWADSPVLLFNLRQDAADTLRNNINNANPATKPVHGMWNNFVAYSKICTHAGCPASLYEQQTHRLLCPCHQSQFKIIDQAKPIFGPAHRRLPMLPLGVEDGFFVALSDFTEAVGPAFWERPS